MSILVDEDKQVYQSTSLPTLTWTVVDADGSAINLSGATVVLTVYAVDGTTLFTLSGAAVVISGASSNIVTATHTAANTATVGHYRYTLRKTNSGAERTLAVGDFHIRDYRNLP